MKKRIVILAGILALAVAFAGCGKKKQEDKTAANTQTTVAPVQQESKKQEGALVDMKKSTDTDTNTIKNVMGQKTENSVNVVLTNKTGDEISAVYIRPNTDMDDEWGDDLVQGAFKLKNGDQAIYYCDKDRKDEDGNTVTLYDIRITYTDEEKSECFFRKLPLPTITKLSLCMDGTGEDAIPYATYFSGSSKKEVSTLEEVKKRLGMMDDSDDTDSSDEDISVTPTPSQNSPQDYDDSSSPEPTLAPATEQEDPTEEIDPNAQTAEQYIGRPLGDLVSHFGEGSGSDYVNEPETGETGYHYYDTFTVSTTIDENGNEIVAGVW